MAYFRHANRHLQMAVENRVHDILSWGEWFGPATPFRTSPVDYVRTRVEESEKRPIRGNLVAIVFGDEASDTERELGGGLLGYDMMAWIDVVGQSESVTMAIADDIKAGLNGRNPEFSPFIQVRDFSKSRDGEPVDGWTAEVTSVERLKPDPTEWRRYWTSLVVTTEVIYTP